MADLDSAADAALARLKEMAGHIEEAQEACASLREEVERAGQALDDDWEALEEKARALMERVPAESERVSQAAQAASAGLGEVAGVVEAAGTEAEQGLEAARATLAAEGESVEGLRPQLAAMLEQAQSALAALQEQAEQASTSVEEAVADAREFLESEVPGHLGELQEQVRSRGEEVRQTLADECAASLDEAFASWQSAIEAVEAKVEQAFADARQHAEDVVTYSLKECRQAHEEELDEIVQLLDATLGPALEKLEGAIEQRGGEVDQSHSTLETQLEETGRGLESAIAALQRVKALLASYTFVQI